MNALEQQQKDVAQEIDKVEKATDHLCSARPEIWLDEVDDLRAEEKQLHDEAEQVWHRQFLILAKSDAQI